ncbi:MAG: universal stress protein [Arenibacter latericius]|nr:universal stress protein [Arenibacter latericius]
MSKHVLLPTDFSQNAQNAINYAVKLYREQPCDFYLLNVFGLSGYSLDKMMVPEPGELAYEAAKDNSEEELHKLQQHFQITSENTAHSFHTISVFNSLLEGVKQAINKKDIDIVVMGTKGKSGAARALFGSNTVEVMEKITLCPVIAVPEKVRFITPKEIVFPTDFKCSFKRRELQYLLDILKLHHAEVQILHIGTESGLNKTQLENKKLLSTIFKEVEHVFCFEEGDKIPAEIKKFISERGSNMLAFVNRKHGFLENIFTKPLIKEVSYSSDIPILALHDSA